MVMLLTAPRPELSSAGLMFTVRAVVVPLMLAILQDTWPHRPTENRPRCYYVERKMSFHTRWCIFPVSEQPQVIQNS